MQTSVNLQPPFSYSLIYIVACIIVLTILTIFTIYIFIKKSRKEKNVQMVQNVKQEVVNIEKVKNKYLKKLKQVEEDVDSGKMNIRKAYQSISSITRYFVFETTNIKVQKYTLTEIEKLDMPILFELMQEYYEPEFSKYSIGDVKASIDKTRKVIEKWN